MCTWSEEPSDSPFKIPVKKLYSMVVACWHCDVQELAVMVARSRNGEIKAFPVVETIHKDNICHTTEAPARVPHQVQLNAQQVASQAVACLEGENGTHCLFMALPIPHWNPWPPSPPPPLPHTYAPPLPCVHVHTSRPPCQVSMRVCELCITMTLHLFVDDQTISGRGVVRCHCTDIT